MEEEVKLDGKNKHNMQMAENEELLENFVQLFSLYNDFDMPMKVAVAKFKKIISFKSEDILPTDTEKIVKLCVEVKKEYYEKDRGLIVDEDGNPNIDANMKENSKFLNENPDIAVVLEDTIKENKLEALREERVEKFFEVFFDLSEEEQKDFTDKLIEDLRDACESLKEDEESKEKVDVFFEKTKEIMNKENKDIDPCEVYLIGTYFLKFKDEEFDKIGLALLSKVMPKEDLKLFFTNREKFEKYVINSASALIDGKFDSFEQMNQELEKRWGIKEKDIIEDIKKLNISKQESIYQKEEIKFDESKVEEIEIYQKLRKIDFNDSRNVAAIVKLYSNLEKSSENSEGRENLKNVLNKMIFSSRYIKYFGEFRNGNDLNFESIEQVLNTVVDGRKEIDEYDRFEEKILKKIDSGEVIRDNEYLITRQGVKNINQVESKKQKYSKVRIENNIEEYKKLLDEFNSTDDVDKKNSIKVKIKEKIAFMNKKAEFAFLFKDGKLDEEKVLHYNEEKTEDLLKTVLKIHKANMTEASKGEVKKLEKGKEYILELVKNDESLGQFSDGAANNVEILNRVNTSYNEYKQAYLEKKSFYNIYSRYADGEKFEQLNALNKGNYLRSLAITYQSKNSKVKEFSYKFIKQLDETGIPLLDKNGNVIESNLLKLCNSYTSGFGYESLENIKINDAKRKCSDFEKEVLENPNYKMEEVELDEGNVEKIVDSLELEKGERKPARYGKKEKYTNLFEDFKKDGSSLIYVYNELNKKFKVIEKTGQKIDERTEEEKLLCNAIRDFITNDENRVYFADLINIRDLGLTGDKEEKNIKLNSKMNIEKEEELKKIGEKLKENNTEESLLEICGKLREINSVDRKEFLNKQLENEEKDKKRLENAKLSRSGLKGTLTRVPSNYSLAIKRKSYNWNKEEYFKLKEYISIDKKIAEAKTPKERMKIERQKARLEEYLKENDRYKVNGKLNLDSIKIEKIKISRMIKKDKAALKVLQKFSKIKDSEINKANLNEEEMLVNDSNENITQITKVADDQEVTDAEMENGSKGKEENLDDSAISHEREKVGENLSKGEETVAHETGTTIEKTEVQEAPTTLEEKVEPKEVGEITSEENQTRTDEDGVKGDQSQYSNDEDLNDENNEEKNPAESKPRTFFEVASDFVNGIVNRMTRKRLAEKNDSESRNKSGLSTLFDSLKKDKDSNKPKEEKSMVANTAEQVSTISENKGSYERPNAPHNGTDNRQSQDNNLVQQCIVNERLAIEKTNNSKSQIGNDNKIPVGQNNRTSSSAGIDDR